MKLPLLSSEFRKNTFRLLSANVVSQAVALAIYPIVTRIYSPEEFGTFNLFLSICSIFFILSTGRYEYAILLPKSDKDSAAVFRLCLRINTWFSLFLLMLILLAEDQILLLFNNRSLEGSLYLIPILVFMNALGIILTYWFNRYKRFDLTSRYTLTQNLGNSVLKILNGKLGYTKVGLIWATIAGQILALFSVLFIKNKKYLFGRLKKTDNERIKKVAQIYSNYPKYSMFNAFLNMFSGNLPTLMLIPFFGERMIGFYALAITAGFRPLNLISGSLNQVLFQQISERYNQRKPILHIYTGFLKKGFLYLLPVFILIFLFSSPLVSFIFGSEWEETSTNLNILLPWFFLTLFSGTFMFIPSIFFKQKMAMIIQCFYFVSKVIVLVIGIYYNSYYLSMALYSSIGVLFLTLYLFWFYRILKRYEQNI